MTLYINYIHVVGFKRVRQIKGGFFLCVSGVSGVLFMYTLEGVSTVANFITAYEESQ